MAPQPRDSWSTKEIKKTTISHKRSSSLQNVASIKPKDTFDADAFFDVDDLIAQIPEYEEKLQLREVNEVDEFNEFDDMEFYDYNAVRSDELSSESLHDLQEVDRDRASTLGVSRISIAPEVKSFGADIDKEEAPHAKRESVILREIELDEAAIDEDEKAAFDAQRKMDFDDLMDGLFDDDEDDDFLLEPLPISRSKTAPQSQEIEEKETLDKMTLKQLLNMFNLGRNTSLYAYYYDTLGVRNAVDLLKHSPAAITQPLQFRSTRLRMSLTKMSKFVMNKVRLNEWSGAKSTEWLQLETNTVSRVFSPPPTAPKMVTLPPDIIHSSEIYFESSAASESNQIELVGPKISCIDRIIELEATCALKIHIEEIPNIDRKSKYDALILGCNFYDGYDNRYESVYITDRCLIYREPLFLSALTLTNPVLLETASEIHIKIENHREEPVITFAHYRKGRMFKHNEREIVLDGLHQPINSYAKLFVEQSYGRGAYSVYEILKIDKTLNDKQQDMKQQERSTVISNRRTSF